MSLLVADDSVLSKTHSKKIELVNYQYSGNQHVLAAGIELGHMLSKRQCKEVANEPFWQLFNRLAA